MSDLNVIFKSLIYLLVHTDKKNKEVDQEKTTIVYCKSCLKLKRTLIFCMKKKSDKTRFETDCAGLSVKKRMKDIKFV